MLYVSLPARALTKLDVAPIFRKINAITFFVSVRTMPPTFSTLEVFHTRKLESELRDGAISKVNRRRRRIGANLHDSSFADDPAAPGPAFICR